MMRGLEHERESAIVFVVDDDPSSREALDSLLHSVRLGVQTFASARDFLASKRPDMPSCLVLDVQLRGLSGLGLQQELAKANIQIPIIFITGHGDIPTSVRAMKAGAVEFLTKPFRDKKLLDAIDEALKRDRAARSEQAKLAELQGCYESLTPREREVMAHVTAGMLNKQIAAKLNTAEKTIKFHRAHIMEKMGAGSLAELVQMAVDLGLLRSRT
jgi:FixJ family two-component response regulator